MTKELTFEEVSLKNILLAVLILHFCLVICVGMVWQPMEVKSVRPRLVARTIQLTQQSVRSQPIASPKSQQILLSEPQIDVHSEEPSLPVEVKKEILAAPKPVPEPMPKTIKAEKKEISQPSTKVAKKSLKQPTQAKPKPKPQPQPQPQSQSQSEPQPKVQSKPKSQPKPKPQPEGETPIKPQESAEAVAAKMRRAEALAKAKQLLGNMGQHKEVAAVALAEIAIPSQIHALNSELVTIEMDGEMSPGEISYRDELAARLQRALKLPEWGDVKIKLTLSQSGRYIKMQIIKHTSTKNKNYVENTLPSVVFPPFGSRLGGATEHTFLISLTQQN